MKRLALLFLVMLLLAGGCDRNPKQWTSCLSYSDYGLVRGTHVKSVTITTYNEKGELLSTKTHDFNERGNIVKIRSQKKESEAEESIYEYVDDRLVKITSSTGEIGRPHYDKNGFLDRIDSYNKEKAHWITETYDYNSDGLLCSYSSVKDPDIFQSEGHTGWQKQEWQKTYHDSIPTSYTGNDETPDADGHGKKQMSFQVVYNEAGLEQDITYEYNYGTPIIKVHIDYYKYDEQNNWTERIIKEKKGKKRITEKRQIEYYSPEEINAVMMIETSQNLGFAGRLGGYFGGVKERLAILSYEYAGSAILTILVLLLAVGCMIYLMTSVWKPPFVKRHQLANGMQRLWMYDSAIYLNVLGVFGIVLGSFLAAVLAFAIVGGIAWLVAWIIKIFFMILIVIGWIATIVGVIGIFARSGIVALLVVGIPILLLKDTLTEWGEGIVSASTSFLHRVNLLGWTFGFVTSLWDVILLVIFAPLAAFLVVAVSIILFNALLNATDYIFTRIYSIHRPCPCCGSKEILQYVVNGKVHPVKLQPGMYGIFRHYSPAAGKYIPTMLLNGKGKLTRQCPKCHTVVNPNSASSFGTDIHIGFVGPRSSGKSYLLFSGLNLFLQKFPNNVEQTDKVQDTAIVDKAQRIARGEGIQTSVANQYRAIQLMVKPSKTRLVPYHLFFYDVAGEKFDAKSSSYKTAMSFYQNVQSIVFILDPSMIDFAGLCPSRGILNWAASVNKGETHNPENAFSVLLDILETVGRQAKEINFSFVCTKSDLGYFEAENMNSAALTEAKIKEFIKKSLGLANLVNSAENSFKSVHYFEVSIKDEKKVKKLFEDVIEQQADNKDIFV